MTAQRFRKRPVEIEAWQLTAENIEDVGDWIAEESDLGVSATVAGPDAHLEITTLEGAMRAVPGDWIIRGVKGEFYPCKPDIFAATCEPVTDPEAVPVMRCVCDNDGPCAFHAQVWEHHRRGWWAWVPAGASWLRGFVWRLFWRAEYPTWQKPSGDAKETP